MMILDMITTTAARRLTMVLLASVVLGQLTGCGPSERRQAEEMLSHGDCRSAHTLYEIVVQDRPRDHRAAVGAALAAWCAGDNDRINRLAQPGLAQNRERANIDHYLNKIAYFNPYF